MINGLRPCSEMKNVNCNLLCVTRPESFGLTSRKTGEKEKSERRALGVGERQVIPQPVSMAT